MKGLSYKWIVATVVIFGIFMSILDTTIVNIAIPRLQTAFKVLTFLIIGVSSLVTFVLVEFLVVKSGKQPLLDLRVFGNMSFAGGNSEEEQMAFIH